MAQQQPADDDCQHSGDQLQPKIRNLTSTDEADALKDAADDEKQKWPQTVR